MIEHSRVELALGEPWLITPEGMQQIVAIAERSNDIDALMARSGNRLQYSRTVQVRDGTAIIPVTGPIFRYANIFSAISGATSTQVLATDFRAALDDPTVRDIVFEFNSPGGAVEGINELGDMVFEARSEGRRIIAYAGGNMASAAYWIGSAADEIVASPTAVVGSIGAIMTLTDSSGRDARAGVRTLQIVSSQSPDKVVDPYQDAGRAKLQKIVDDLAAVFVSTVARNRDVEVETVLSDFGGGGVMVGQAAVDAGLADRLGSLESVLAELSAARQSQRSRSFLMSKTTTTGAAAKGPITVETTQQLHAALAAGHTAEEITIKAVDIAAIQTEAVAAFQKGDVFAKAITDAKAEATTAERTRVAALQDISIKGFEKELTAAIKDGSTAEALAVAQSKAVRERGTSVSTQAADAPAAIGHGGKTDRTTSAGGEKPWGNITSKFKRKTG